MKSLVFHYTPVTVIPFCHPSPEDMLAIKGILNIFGVTSGLWVNYSKSLATLIQGSPEGATVVAQHFGCPIVDFPITHLGIPLMVRKPTAAKLPMVEKAQGKLPTWKSHLMNKPGRLQWSSLCSTHYICISY
jgi:hypothetical protein